MNSQQSTPSSTLPLLAIVISTFLSLISNNSVNASCSHTFSDLAHKKNISYCKALRTLEAEFAWKYNKFANFTTLEVLFGARLKRSEGWIAWGVNPGDRAEMVGTKALIGIKHHDTPLMAKTYDITKEIRTGCNLQPSNISELHVSNLSMQFAGGSNLYIMYARLVLPSDMYNITRLQHVWQVGYDVKGDQPLGHPTTLHNVDSTETIDLTSSVGHSMGQKLGLLRSVHGVLNIIGWGTLLPAGVIIARYFRVFPFQWESMWFYMHIACQLTGFLVGTAGWIIGLSLGHSSRYYVFHTHRIFGIAIFTFSTIQMLAFRLKPKISDDYRKYWNMYHHFLGYGLLVIIIINIFQGLSILQGGDEWKWVYVGILAFFGAVVFGLEIFTWVRFFMLKAQRNQPELRKGDTTKQKAVPK